MEWAVRFLTPGTSIVSGTFWNVGTCFCFHCFCATRSLSVLNLGNLDLLDHVIDLSAG